MWELFEEDELLGESHDNDGLFCWTWMLGSNASDDVLEDICTDVFNSDDAEERKCILGGTSTPQPGFTQQSTFFLPTRINGFF